MTELIPTSSMLLSIDEIYNKYPDLEKSKGWTKDDLKLFYEYFLVKGEVNIEEGEEIVRIDVDSFERLIAFHEEVQKENKQINKK